MKYAGIWGIAEENIWRHTKTKKCMYIGFELDYYTKLRGCVCEKIVYAGSV